MDVEIKTGTEGIDWEELDRVFISAPLSSRPAKIFQKACEYSPVIKSAWDGDRIIGFGRAFTDFVAYGAIYDVVVHKDYQGHGIGKNIMNAILSDLEMCSYITLFMAPGNEKFYGSLGFSSMKSAMMVVKDGMRDQLVSRGHIESL